MCVHLIIIFHLYIYFFSVVEIQMTRFNNTVSTGSPDAYRGTVTESECRQICMDDPQCLQVSFTSGNCYIYYMLRESKGDQGSVTWKKAEVVIPRKSPFEFGL